MTSPNYQPWPEEGAEGGRAGIVLAGNIVGVENPSGGKIFVGGANGAGIVFWGAFTTVII